LSRSHEDLSSEINYFKEQAVSSDIKIQQLEKDQAEKDKSIEELLA
jgi:hypothetical protein